MFQPPSFTMVPNSVMDQWLAELSGGEIKVLLYVIRRTLGWHRESEPISLRQIVSGRPGLDNGTGLSMQTVIDSSRRLVERGMIRVVAGDGQQSANIYELVFEDDEAAPEDGPDWPSRQWLADAFELFWTNYPARQTKTAGGGVRSVKAGKQPAKALFNRRFRAIKTLADAEDELADMIEAARRYGLGEQAYIMDAERWLRGGHDADEIGTATAVNGKGGLPLDANKYTKGVYADIFNRTPPPAEPAGS